MPAQVTRVPETDVSQCQLALEGCVEYVGAGKERGDSGMLGHTGEPSQCRGLNTSY